MSFKHLDWDSDFFNFKIGKIELHAYSNHLIEQLEQLRQKKYTLIYIFLRQEIKISNPILHNFNGILVDRKVTYKKKLKTLNEINEEGISKYESELLDNDLLDLAIQSGEFSRFKIDKQINLNKFKELYNIWMVNSIQKKIAKEIFVYKEEKILGFITLGEKNNRADIGLIAVDKFGRGKGIGRKLMISAENWAIDQNYKEIQVVTQGENKKACQFYEKCNYTIDKTEFIFHFWL